MPNFINNRIADAVYVELTHCHEVHALIRFVWINDRLFLPLFFLNNDEAEAITLALADSEVEIYSRGMMDYFVPYEWLRERRSDIVADLVTMWNIAEPFRQKLLAEPCRVCRHGSVTKTGCGCKQGEK